MNRRLYLTLTFIILALCSGCAGNTSNNKPSQKLQNSGLNANKFFSNHKEFLNKTHIIRSLNRVDLSQSQRLGVRSIIYTTPEDRPHQNQIRILSEYGHKLISPREIEKVIPSNAHFLIYSTDKKDSLIWIKSYLVETFDLSQEEAIQSISRVKNISENDLDFLQTKADLAQD